MFKLVDALFGCGHRNCTFPITAARTSHGRADAPASAGKTYIVCLDCGKEFLYDWQQMKVVTPAKHEHEAVA